MIMLLAFFHYMLSAGVCLSVTLAYCFQTAKHVMKLFIGQIASIILVFLIPSAVAQLQGEPSHRGHQTHDDGKKIAVC